LKRGDSRTLRRALSRYNFDQPHDVCGAEKMQTDYRFRTRAGRCNIIHIQVGGVGCQSGRRFSPWTQLAEDSLFYLDVLESCFNHDVRLTEAVIIELQPDSR